MRTKKSLDGLLKMIKYIGLYFNQSSLSLLEIGSWVGVSTELFAKYFRKVVAVDPWSKTVGINTQYNMRQVEKEFDNRIKIYDNVEKMKMTSKKFAEFSKKEYVRCFDVIYIDGAHDYKNVYQDIKLWKDRCKYFICGHDFYDKFPGVKKAVRELLGEPDKLFPDSSWLIRK
jgi:hypothetical protein